MCFYVRVSCALVRNLCRRLWTDLADGLVLVKRRVLYRLRKCFSYYDDVGPDDTLAQDRPSQQSDIGKEFEDNLWYLNVDRKSAEELVMTGGDGCFIVRKSSKHPLTLTLKYRNRSYNIPIRKREDSKIALGSRKQNERTFDTVEELIKHYGKEELILFSGGQKTGKVALTRNPNQEQIDRICRDTCHHVLVHVPQ